MTSSRPVATARSAPPSAGFDPVAHDAETCHRTGAVVLADELERRAQEPHLDPVGLARRRRAARTRA